MSTPTAGEILFERYLRDRGIDFDPQVPVGRSKVDYRLKTTPAVFCEVKDFSIGPHERAEAAAFTDGQHVYGGRLDFYKRLRDDIGKAHRQLRDATGSPCVVVLHNDGSSLMFEESFVWGAMFGDQVVEVPIEGEGTTRFTLNRVLGDDKNRAVSAVAVLLQTEARRELIEQATGEANATTQAIAHAVVALAEEAPEAFARVPYLRIHHNPFARIALPRAVFDGPHDQHPPPPRLRNG